MDWQLVSPSRLGRENRTELVAEGANHVDLEAVDRDRISSSACYELGYVLLAAWELLGLF
jgi:hypothetical protein